MPPRRFSTPNAEIIGPIEFDVEYKDDVETLKARVAYLVRSYPYEGLISAAVAAMGQHLGRSFVPERIAPVLAARIGQLLSALPAGSTADPLERAASALLALGHSRSRALFPTYGPFSRHWADAMDAAPSVWMTWTGAEASPPAAAAAAAAQGAASTALVVHRHAGPPSRAVGVDDDDDDEVRVADAGDFLAGLGRAVDRRLDQRVPPMAHAAAAAHAHAARTAAAADTRQALREAAPALAGLAADHARQALRCAGPEVAGLAEAAAFRQAQQLAAHTEAQLAAFRAELASQLAAQFANMEARLEGRLAARDAARAAAPRPPPGFFGHAARAGRVPGRFGEAAGDSDNDEAAAPARGGQRAAPARAARFTDDDLDGPPSDASAADELERLLQGSRRRADAFARAPPVRGPALWDPEVCLQGEATLRVWAAHGVGQDPNATATLLATWRASVEAALPAGLRASAAAVVANAVAMLHDGGDLTGSLARRVAVDLTFHAVAARHGVAVGSDVAASMRTDILPADLRRRIQAARRADGHGSGHMVLGDREAAAADVDAVTLHRDTDPSHPRYHHGGGAGRNQGRGRGRGGARAATQQQQPAPRRQSPQQRPRQQQQAQAQAQAQAQPQQQQQQPRGNGGRGRA